MTWAASDAGGSGIGTVQVWERYDLPKLGNLLGPPEVICSYSYGGSVTFASANCQRPLRDPLLPGPYCYWLVVADYALNTVTKPEICYTALP